jgi:hypothetical protein
MRLKALQSLILELIHKVTSLGYQQAEISQPKIYTVYFVAVMSINMFKFVPHIPLFM